MARARNLKPSFFMDDVLAEVPALGRLLFAGLWTMADREGRLEDRPNRIKAEILPYDNCSIEKLLQELAKRRYIIRYEIDEHRFIQVRQFKKHQNPHVKEPASTIPAPGEHRAKTDASTVQAPDSSGAKPEVAGRIPDSGFPLTDSGLRTLDSGSHPPDPGLPQPAAPTESTRPENAVRNALKPLIRGFKTEGPPQMSRADQIAYATKAKGAA